MKSFAAIDFETANPERTSVCSVGIVIVRNGEIKERYYSLIRPEPEYYWWQFTQIHGLTLEDTENARNFPKLENHQLHTVSEHCGYILENHHNALADAKACAAIAMKIL